METTRTSPCTETTSSLFTEEKPIEWKRHENSLTVSRSRSLFTEEKPIEWKPEVAPGQGWQVKVVSSLKRNQLNGN